MDEIRPIDANALKEKLLNTSRKTISITTIKKVFPIIDEAPTINPEKKLQTPSCLTNPERQAELLERYKEE